jgi:hypothetical protein
LSCLPVWAWGQNDYNFRELFGRTTTNNGNIIFDKSSSNCIAVLWYKSGGLVVLFEKGVYKEKSIIEALEKQRLQTDAFPIYKVFCKPAHYAGI